MFKNYLIIAFRNIKRNKTYSFINIFGLAVGMACFILISMWILDEFSYDKFHKNIDNIYRVNAVTAQGRIVSNSSLRIGKELQTRYPEIESYTNFIPWARSLVKYEDKVYDEKNIYLVDPEFFTMFTFDFITGDSSSALSDMYSLVITDETAKKYFGNDDPIGKQLYFDAYNRLFKVTAVVKKMPQNSTLQFNIVASIELMPLQRRESWEFSGWTYVMLKKDASEEKFNNQIKNFYKDYVSSDAQLYPQLQSYSSIHLYETGEAGLIKLIYIFSAVAIFVLIIAFANFSNLSTARATKRALEVGVRKVNGANKGQLVVQFISEAIFVSFISLILAIWIVLLVLPFFNQFTLKSIEFFNEQFVYYFFGLLVMALFTGIVAGGYPAFILSSFKPITMLKSKSASIRSGSIFRRVLTIIQFTISVVLVISTIIVSRQMQYVQEIDLGMDRSNIVTFDSNPELLDKFDTFKSELLKNPLIKNVTASATRPFNVGQSISINWEGHMNEDSRNMQYTMVDYDFLLTLDMTLLAGRTFSKDFATDESEACLINETAASILGFDNPVGKTLYFGHPAFPEASRNLKIIGVVKDFHSRSLQNPIAPFVFKMHRPWHSFIFIKLNPVSIKEAIAHIEAVTKKISPDYPFSFEFLNDSYNNLYLMEMKMETIFNVFAIITIIVSCLGLFGLAAFTAEQKTKEIGIRKVFGASVVNITTILSKQFAVWVVIANLIAWPIAYYFMNEWLHEFAYKIDISWWMFILSGGIALLIAIATVSFQVLKEPLQILWRV